MIGRKLGYRESCTHAHFHTYTHTHTDIALLLHAQTQATAYIASVHHASESKHTCKNKLIHHTLKKDRFAFDKHKQQKNEKKKGKFSRPLAK